MIIRNPLLFGICPPSCTQLQHHVSKASCISNLMCKPKQVNSLEAMQCVSVALSKGSTTQVCARGRKQSWLLKCSIVTVWQTTEEVQSKKSVSKFSAISEDGGYCLAMLLEARISSASECWKEIPLSVHTSPFQCIQQRTVSSLTTSIVPNHALTTGSPF